ncbi:hypothetical protein GCM10009533_19990 [Saccharopolyspora spinosporotrichia]|uniref:Uncharacterized protein n=1 Tax=Saccharopolyspora erythraea TaxID=1836 RepID=A0ABP3MIE6_SACER
MSRTASHPSHSGTGTHHGGIQPQETESPTTDHSTATARPHANLGTTTPLRSERSSIPPNPPATAPAVPATTDQVTGEGSAGRPPDGGTPALKTRVSCGRPATRATRFPARCEAGDAPWSPSGRYGNPKDSRADSLSR